jgi:cytochrome c
MHSICKYSLAPILTRSTTVPTMALKDFLIFITKDETMKRSLFALLAAAIVAGPALASPELAQKKNCLSCHAVDHKVVGPGYKDIAKQYAGKDVAVKLATKIIKGGSGAWGVIPMPANPQVNEAEAKQLVTWILSLK